MIEKREALEQELHSVRDYIRWGASRFSEAKLFMGHGTDSAWDEAVQLVLFSLHLPRDSGPEVLDARLATSERKEVIATLERRIAERIPASYITGEAWFSGLPFNVDARVLVPRSPIAELIEQGFEPWLSQEPARILDLCTGSGCIGIACALTFPNSQVDISDISTEALAVAQSNIDRHQVEDQVEAIESDLFAGLHGNQYDLIVSNPPYVNEGDLASMPDEYHAEPSIGLGSGKDGLDFTRRLLAEAEQYLSEDGVLIVEVGNSWMELDDQFPLLPFTWIEFERGGHGVFVLTAQQLREQLRQHH